MNELFEKIFGCAPQFTAAAHGRVNLIGEHTDYNGGFVLPTPIPQATVVSLALRSDMEVRIFSVNIFKKDSSHTPLSYLLGHERPRKEWIDYIQGVTSVLKSSGYGLKGFDLLIDSQVPMGSGVSSSAALEVSVLKVLSSALELKIDPIEIARLGQRVENDFVGARVGIMDQMAASIAVAGEALFIDTRSLEYERIALPPAEVELLVLNSGIHHSNAHGGYNQRREECEKACALLGIDQLRDVEFSKLVHLDALPEVLKRRARHVITENQRVLEAVNAIRAKDMTLLGELFKRSHLSMRDDYEVSVPEVDLLVDLANSQTDSVYGARLTGGGFGGSIVALVHKGRVEEVSAFLRSRYKEQTGIDATQLVPQGAGDKRSSHFSFQVQA